MGPAFGTDVSPNPSTSLHPLPSIAALAKQNVYEKGGICQCNKFEVDRARGVSIADVVTSLSRQNDAGEGVGGQKKN